MVGMPIIHQQVAGDVQNGEVILFNPQVVDPFRFFSIQIRLEILEGEDCFAVGTGGPAQEDIGIVVAIGLGLEDLHRGIRDRLCLVVIAENLEMKLPGNGLLELFEDP